jgi:flagellar biogenesis protein FliO
MPLGLGRGNGPLKVLAALPLGPRERLVLVEARGEELLIAVSPAGVFNVGAAGARTPVSAGPTESKFVLPDPS